ncbi:MAG TPA: peptidyl-tRNA hydrolase [Methanothermococcus okinawensis]|uniref:Peptidyl-tRNA hydrolase n=1 Tax=Methanothermococcus okinawensis TaxID=155863 RepID=A0A832ZRI9_9EURY|nr:peptidyl-tRNA hydrolase [Methanococcaceae archaeon]HIP84901.1 peptidyl-tRNA hydrolase [Methanothermococcus okinawensis]HIP91148.1 peptidyl-tRNA hydrolase [Methanothermococcus okinawensis]
MYKQVIVVRTDLNMGKGKIATQACHASIDAFIKAQRECPEVVEKWLSEGQKKVVVKVKSQEELMEVFKKATLEGLPCSLIRDAGRTQLTPGTCTAVAIGPEREERIDRITGKLKLL